MATSILILGESGTGKSTSLRNLSPESTFLIPVINKPLPFKNKFKKVTKNEETGESSGNTKVLTDFQKIIDMVRYISASKPGIKTVVIDDFQYVMGIEFMERAKEKGYEKFTELAQHTWKILHAIQNCRDDLSVYILTHSEMKDDGKFKAKTVGKMLDEKVTVEGLFTIVLHTHVQDGKYLFLTQNDGVHLAKTPMGMFDTKYIDNDLGHVQSNIEKYYAVEEQQDIPQ